MFAGICSMCFSPSCQLDSSLSWSHNRLVIVGLCLFNPLRSESDFQWDEGDEQKRSFDREFNLLIDLKVIMEKQHHQIKWILCSSGICRILSTFCLHFCCLFCLKSERAIFGAKQKCSLDSNMLDIARYRIKEKSASHCGPVNTIRSFRLLPIYPTDKCLH